mmetsp:Transcript_12298/g.18633  ORF Transcript_12298/g.18633 Transcript_12298/m.18633 type:complete len:237 (+) Transcript_12298:70-780(+)|eukprot:CAMPEP_0185029920 /NCGR_PEP_ID=MMETSP1103-20130426/16570_1 /TAXON_ID=36769 /ORGANISM="Paraphysomonas bandaiensis, Strain Caron Lab Isolate" /LENGTH=236 /DNA_ID=CAMNT_0027564849 /DNA_START=10 /DNA_END=720 /DNA_ORIENTATION=+
MASFLSPTHNENPASTMYQTPGNENSTDNARTLFSSPNTKESSSETEVTDAERERKDAEQVQREIEESERLAFQLMEEESMRAYQMQVEYMTANPDLFSQEEMQALNLVLSEQGNNDQDEEEVDEDLNSSDASNWTYEQLLEIGQAVGDVKTERWRLRSQQVIDSIPAVQYDDITKNSEQYRSLDLSCPVCMDDYASDDKINVLPCGHYFHGACCEGWLQDNNSCPMCKKKITQSP